MCNCKREGTKHKNIKDKYIIAVTVFKSGIIAFIVLTVNLILCRELQQM